MAHFMEIDHLQRRYTKILNEKLKTEDRFRKFKIQRIKNKIDIGVMQSRQVKGKLDAFAKFKQTEAEGFIKTLEEALDTTEEEVQVSKELKGEGVKNEEEDMTNSLT